MTDDERPDELTDRQAEILATMRDHLEKHNGRPAGFIPAGTIGGLLGYRATAECHEGRIAGGVMGRLRKRGLVEKADGRDCRRRADEMVESYRPSEYGLELLEKCEARDG